MLARNILERLMKLPIKLSSVELRNYVIQHLDLTKGYQCYSSLGIIKVQEQSNFIYKDSFRRILALFLQKTIWLD